MCTWAGSSAPPTLPSVCAAADHTAHGSEPALELSALKVASLLARRFSLEAQHGSSGQPHGRSRGEQALAPWSASQPSVSKKGVRYRDGFAVASKGEKHIEVPGKEEWNGGSSGKVYTKGKRGKGIV